MTALTDIQRVAGALSRGHEADERILLRYYGATGDRALAQADLAREFGVSRQAMSARIKRLLARVDGPILQSLTLPADAINDLVHNGVAAPEVLGGVRLEDAARFYRDILHIDPAEDSWGRIPGRQFDALVKAAFGARRQAQVLAARLVLVTGWSVEKARLETGVPASKIRSTAREIARLHTMALRAYRR